jgi:hypothetical protein
LGLGLVRYYDRVFVREEIRLFDSFCDDAVHCLVELWWPFSFIGEYPKLRLLVLLGKSLEHLQETTSLRGLSMKVCPFLRPVDDIE